MSRMSCRIPDGEDCPPEWNKPNCPDEVEAEAIQSVAEDYLNRGRIDSETEEEFRGFYLQDNIDQIIFLGLNPEFLKSLLEEKWRNHCVEEAMVHVRHGSYWSDVRRNYEAEDYFN